MHVIPRSSLGKLHNIILLRFDQYIFSKILRFMDFLKMKLLRGSGVVGRERMGTAFPHKKLSGNGVPTREILRDIFLLAILHYRHVMTFSAYETISKLDIRICKVLAH